MSLALKIMLKALLLAGFVTSAFARDAIAPTKAIRLFNGKDLTNFYSYLDKTGREDPMKVFTVRDGMIRISGEGWGGLTTNDAFRDYHLIVEWKWGAKTWGAREKATRDSGILLHCQGPDGNRSGYWMQSIEYQIIEGGTGDFILVDGSIGKAGLTSTVRMEGKQMVFDPAAPPLTRDSGRFNWWGRDPEWKDVIGFRGKHDVEKPAGQWNRSEVIADGDRIYAILNGKLVNFGTKAWKTSGKLLIQSEGAEIFVRKVELRPVPKNKPAIKIPQR